MITITIDEQGTITGENFENLMVIVRKREQTPVETTKDDDSAIHRLLRPGIDTWQNGDEVFHSGYAAWVEVNPANVGLKVAAGGWPGRRVLESLREKRKPVKALNVPNPISEHVEKVLEFAEVFGADAVDFENSHDSIVFCKGSVEFRITAHSSQGSDFLKMDKFK